MPENPWYMMRKNPLLPDDWGDREGMIRRRERLNLVAWAINTLPYAFEVSRTVGPYVDRLVYEVRSRGDADMFCSAVTSMSTDFRHETIRAWTMTPKRLMLAERLPLMSLPATCGDPRQTSFAVSSSS